MAVEGGQRPHAVIVVSVFSGRLYAQSITELGVPAGK
jgi:hypothetical protein